MAAIEVDEDVFRRLQARATPFVDKPNDVIRRLLDEVEEGSAGNGRASRTASVDDSQIGRLRGLIEAGLVEPGDTVRHRRKRTGEVFRATITAGGCLRVDGADRLFGEPSPALRHFTGSQIDGWNNWMHERSEKTLRQLRDEGTASSEA